MKRFFSIGLLLLMLCASRAATAEPSPALRSDQRLLVAGGSLLAFGYAIPLALALRFDQPELVVPVLGPLIDLRRCHNCTGSAIESGIIAGLVLDSAIQSVGLILITVGIIRRPHRIAAPATAPMQ